MESQVSCTSSRFQTPPATSIPSPFSILNCRVPLTVDRLKSMIFSVYGILRTIFGPEERVRDKKSERFEYWLAWSNIYFIDSDVNQQMFYRRKISWIINYEFTTRSTLFDIFNIRFLFDAEFWIAPPLIWNWPGWLAKWRRDFKYVERLTIWENHVIYITCSHLNDKKSPQIRFLTSLHTYIARYIPSSSDRVIVSCY